LVAENSSRTYPQREHTPGHLACPVCARAHQMLYQALSPELLFPEAFEVWMSHRTLETGGRRVEASYLARKTERDYRCCFKALGKFFGQLRLEEIHVGHLMEYQRARAVCDRAAGGWARRSGANCIRKEVALLIRILRGARVWGDEQDLHFQRLRPVESDAVRAMTPEEQHNFLHVAASRIEFRFIYQYAIVALQTTASTNELRALRLSDILLRDRVIQIPAAGAKNKYRMRTIPLVTDDVIWALEGLIARARELGATAPWHYLFPRQAARTHYDASRPISESGLKKPWDAVRRAAGLPHLRIYDLRHTGITRMAEAGVHLSTIMAFAGHMTQRMQQHYTAISMAAKRSQLEAVWTPAPAYAAAAAQAWPRKGPQRAALAAPAKSA